MVPAKGVLEELKNLEQVMDGKVLWSWSDDGSAFQKAHHVWAEQACLTSPLAVVVPAHEADVQQALMVLIKLHSESGTNWSIKSGGHSYIGTSSCGPGGIVLSLEDLNSLSFDPNTNMASFGPGVLMEDILQIFVQYHHATPVLGTCPGLGAGGFFLGGGIGPLSRLMGIGCDNIVALDAVLANGALVHINDYNYQDLFWALKGAGTAGLAIVTKFYYQMRPFQDVQLIANGIIPISQAALFCKNWIDRDIYNKISLQAYPQLNGCFSLEPDGFPLVLSWASTDDADLVEGRAYIESLMRELLPLHKVDMTYHNISWTQYTKNLGNLGGNYVQAWNGYLMKEQNSEEIWHHLVNSIVEVTSGSDYVIFDTWAMGGAISQKRPDANSFFYRDAVWFISLILMVPTTESTGVFASEVNRVNRAWARDFSPYLTGAYPNIQMASLKTVEEYGPMYWGENFRRLVEIKRKYDPNNVFQHQQSIPTTFF